MVPEDNRDGWRVRRGAGVRLGSRILCVWTLNPLSTPLTVDFPDPSSASAEPGVSPSATFVGWTDAFNDSSRIGASSGVVLTGSDVQLASPGGRDGPLSSGLPGDFDSDEAAAPSVMLDGGTYKMWYFGRSAGTARIGYATSTDGRTWSKQGVVLSPSLPLEGSTVEYPDVVRVGSEYRMWYSGWDGATLRIFSATSTDGVSWTKQGVVLHVGASGEPDDWTVWDPTVVYEAGTYSMWYTGQSTADPPRARILLATQYRRNELGETRCRPFSWSRRFVGRRLCGPSGRPPRRNGVPHDLCGGSAGIQRLFLARSADGVTWQKQGMSGRSRPRRESDRRPAVVPRGRQWTVDGLLCCEGQRPQVYLATHQPGVRIGSLRWVPVPIPQGLDWRWFNQTVSIPADAWLNVTVRDNPTGPPIAGKEKLTAGSVDLRDLAASKHPSLIFEAWLAASQASGPVLDAWEVSWIDAQSPTFGGLLRTEDLGTGGFGAIGMECGTRPERPARVFDLRGGRGGPIRLRHHRLYDRRKALEITGLTNGVIYRFAVPASDRWGNQESNNVTRTVIPTTPVDSTPPSFGGVLLAADGVVGGTVVLGWFPADDPDTPASNSNPSLPIRFLVFIAPAGTPFNFGVPLLTTTNITAIIVGMSDGTEYQFLVRAMDAQGSLDSIS